jgi:hypothetical protein
MAAGHIFLTYATRDITISTASLIIVGNANVHLKSVFQYIKSHGTIDGSPASPLAAYRAPTRFWFPIGKLIDMTEARKHGNPAIEVENVL